MKCYADMQSRLRFDAKLLALAAVLMVTTVFVPPLFRSASIAVALAALVLSAMPRGTRRLTVAAMTGFATGATVICSFAVSIFQGPVTREFGWSQAEYASCLTIGTVVLILVSPPAGRLFDRYGVRQFALGSTLFLGLSLVSLYWLTSVIWQLYLVFALIQLLCVGTSSVAFSRVIGRWFAESRGQAFGTAVAGIGIGGAIVSALSQYMIDTVGWRGGFVGLGLIVLVVTLPILFLWLHDAPDSVGLAQDGRPLAPPTPLTPLTPLTTTTTTTTRAEIAEPLATGLTARESRRSPVFWKMMVAFLVMSLGTGGVMMQMFPILLSHGITPEDAAVIQGALGLALIVGPAVAGWLMDRMFAPYVAAILVLFPMAGTALLATGATGWQATLAAMSIGMAAGAEVNFIAFLIPRYFGTRAYAENFGWLYAAFGLGAGTAPLLTSLCLDILHSPTPVLCMYVGTFALSSILLARLGPYPALAADAPDPLVPVSSMESLLPQ